MNLEQFTQRARQAFLDAQQIAVELPPPAIEPKHVLLDLVGQPEGVVRQIPSQVGVAPQALMDELTHEVAAKPRLGTPESSTGLSRAADVLGEAKCQAAATRDEYLSTEQLLLALITNDEPAAIPTSSRGRARRWI